MVESEIGAFSELLDATCSMLSRGQYTPNELATEMFFTALAQFPLSEVRAAFSAHIRDTQRGRFVPTPADILAQIELAASNDGRPGPEEAWGIAARGADEAATVVWTEEIAAAWGVALPIMRLGDEVGARMAFKESYSGLVGAARRARRAIRWQASIGHDRAQRDSALREALAMGRRVEGAEDLLCLPAPRDESRLLLAGPDAVAMPEGIRERLIALRDQIACGQRASLDAQQKERTEELKREAAQRVGQYGGGGMLQ